MWSESQTGSSAAPERGAIRGGLTELWERRSVARARAARLISLYTSIYIRGGVSDCRAVRRPKATRSQAVYACSRVALKPGLRWNNFLQFSKKEKKTLTHGSSVFESGSEMFDPVDLMVRSAIPTSPFYYIKSL